MNSTENGETLSECGRYEVAGNIIYVWNIIYIAIYLNIIKWKFYEKNVRIFKTNVLIGKVSIK